MNPLYRLLHVHKSFRLDDGVIDVLRGIDLEIGRGEWLSLVGRSGSGKTTLLHLLGTLDRPNQGEIHLDGEDLCRLPGRRLATLRRRKIGFIFQSYHLFPELSAWENALLPALYAGNDRDGAARRARQMLEDFGLGDRLHHRPRELSGGEQQRVAIARSLINSPAILLADEPTGNLDATATAEIFALLKTLKERENLTIVMVTHDQNLAARTDRRVMLKDGKLA